ncbi:MAG: DUF4126 domain-containing protein [Rhodocyclaceae bacterium]|jgi:hypothetical protein|nr:DUF4126 domain-containing protein [Rhodocyclaceae bacterium]MCE2978562.1 DUF4126 domain-containing protein [Betaproteobacteria bacterium]MCA3074620.1 DUF4126 domain-containing protein [Rhodocyclaceae bacterium]MCA3088907.1 DUF4126 domain-containing protein [Rhodocyclaceae bacterium]MCA3095643.1 DUF4126 domain-containing protein [Rhodocyclaceae bacterium]
MVSPELIETLALASGLAWASGIRLYAVLFFAGALGRFGYVDLPGGLQWLGHPLMIAVSGLLCMLEFAADKVPGLDSLWDAVHTFIRIPAGALLAAASLGQPDSAVTLAAMLSGGALASGAHFTKAASRALINTSPEPFSNVAASTIEDALVIGGLWAALFHPAAFLALLLVFVGIMLWLLPRLWRGLRKVCLRVSALLDTGSSAPRPQ